MATAQEFGHIAIVRHHKRPVPLDDISRAILLLRGQRVILDRDLALLYGVSTARLNEAVKRNAARFPVDFMFRLNATEQAGLMSQNATSKIGRGDHRKLPRAFTEHGARCHALYDPATHEPARLESPQHRIHGRNRLEIGE